MNSVLEMTFDGGDVQVGVLGVGSCMQRRKVVTTTSFEALHRMCRPVGKWVLNRLMIVCFARLSSWGHVTEPDIMWSQVGGRILGVTWGLEAAAAMATQDCLPFSPAMHQPLKAGPGVDVGCEES